MTVKAMLHVGVSKDTVKEARVAILEILKAKEVDNTTKQVALEVLKDLCATGQTHISHCNFTGK